jgi:histidinol-phosphate phosphatase family protein
MSDTAPAVFIDRDGTVVREVGYLCRPEQIEILPRVPEAIRKLRSGGYRVVLVTNQSAIARGMLKESELEEIHRLLREELDRLGAALDGVYYCPHHPSEGFAPYVIRCQCRKPNLGLVERAVRDLHLDLLHSYVVGDQGTDMQLARRAGIRGIWIQNGNGDGASTSSAGMKTDCDLVARDLWDAASWILEKALPTKVLGA